MFSGEIVGLVLWRPVMCAAHNVSVAINLYTHFGVSVCINGVYAVPWPERVKFPHNTHAYANVQDHSLARAGFAHCARMSARAHNYPLVNVRTNAHTHTHTQLRNTLIIAVLVKISIAPPLTPFWCWAI